MTKPKRKSLSKKLRFEIFKRDSFTCQYCGAAPPSIVLELDHIMPVSKGGDNDIDNLITSCFNCNRGKGAGKLDCIPQTVVEKAAIAKEKEDQLKELKKQKRIIKSRITRDINSIEAVFKGKFEDYTFSESFRITIKNCFLTKLDSETLADNMEIACSRIDERDSVIKYFCGICWKMIREEDNES